MARAVTVCREESHQLLLDWLSNRFTYHSFEKWAQIIQDNKLHVNGQKPPEDYELKEGDEIQYFPPPRKEPSYNPEYHIEFENEDLLIIDKPADLTVHPGGIYYKHTLWFMLKQIYPEVHFMSRLDRETSGLLLVAKNKETAGFYFQNSMQRSLQKKYFVLVFGSFPDDYTAEGFIEIDPDSNIRKKRRFVKEMTAPKEVLKSQAAKTHFRCIFRNTLYSLLEAELFTGRTHQIRSTLCSLGYPLVGDKIYGPDENIFLDFASGKITKAQKESLKLPFQALHSAYLKIPMQDGTWKEFSSIIPPQWKSLIGDQMIPIQRLISDS